jgi:hypothetical protein
MWISVLQDWMPPSIRQWEDTWQQQQRRNSYKDSYLAETRTEAKWWTNNAIKIKEKTYVDELRNEDKMTNKSLNAWFETLPVIYVRQIEHVCVCVSACVCVCVLEREREMEFKMWAKVF